MNEHIETNAISARNTLTGAKVRRNLVPVDMSSDAFIYEHPNLGLAIGFPACTIIENKEGELAGTMKVLEVVTGIILVEGKLKRLIEAACGPNASAELTSTLLLECYELTSAYHVSFSARYYAVDVHFQIFEVDTKRFNALPDAVGPEAIQASLAKLVFPQP